MKRVLENTIWFLQSNLPKRDKCGMCNRPFWAMPLLDGSWEHRSYCSSECERIQAGIDNCEACQEELHDQKMTERFETW